ncbi:hypothetical protein QBC39DRAFT_357891 [Podospora conica]|nr:hypothetical protein QBC39DRAFT_357891 [Schizothecium conicum]
MNSSQGQYNSSLSGALGSMQPVKEAIKTSNWAGTHTHTHTPRAERSTAPSTTLIMQNGRTTCPGTTRVRHRRNTALIGDLRALWKLPPAEWSRPKTLFVPDPIDCHFMALTGLACQPGTLGRRRTISTVDHHQSTSFDSGGCLFQIFGTRPRRGSESPVDPKASRCLPRPTRTATASRARLAHRIGPPGTLLTRRGGLNRQDDDGPSSRK